MPLAMKMLLALIGAYFCGMAMFSFRRCFCAVCETEQLMGSGGYGSIRSAKHHALDNFRIHKKPIAEAYVISLHESRFNVFEQRHFDLFATSNNGQDDDNTLDSFESSFLEWFPGYDGKNQSVLDEFSRVTGLFTINATLGQEKEDYASPHAAGCYLSHWRLLEKAQKSWKEKKKLQQKLTLTSDTTRIPPSKPDMLFVFEDDTHCVSNLVDRVWKVVQQLPKDWDILYVGGKPFSYYTMNETLEVMATRKFEAQGERPTNDELMKRACRGDFGVSPTGPFAPGTTKEDSWDSVTGANLEEDPPYWQSKWVLNTNAYVVNPKRILRVLRVLSEPMKYYLPVDVKLTYEYHREFMKAYHINENITNPSESALKAYLTPQLYCDQAAHRRIFNRDQTAEWQGFHWMPWKTFAGFPNGLGFVWDKIASRDVCSKFAKGKEKTKK